MRSLAQPASKESATAKRPAIEQGNLAEIEPTDETSILQRKVCPCGGGCPRCLQTKLKVSQPGDPAELEADQVSAAVVQGRLRENGGWRPSPAAIGALHRKADDTILRQPAGESATKRLVAPRIVDDEVEQLGAGQMRKSEFLSTLRTELCQTVDEALKGTSRSTDGCPWIERAFAQYGSRSSSEIESAVARYLRTAGPVESAAGYISAIVARVGRAASVWASTGQITGVPEGIAFPLSEGPLPPSPASPPAPQPAAPEAVSFKTREGATSPATDTAAVRSQLGGGSPLESPVRSRMESAFDTDFSTVRIHNDPTGAGLSDQLSARAFTIGGNIAFAPGEYRPGTPMGDALLAHELAHVVQQGADSRLAHRPEESAASLPDSRLAHRQEDSAVSSEPAFESDANLSAAGAMISLWSRFMDGARDTGRNALPRLRGGLRLQRCRNYGELTDEQREEIWQTAITKQYWELIAKQSTKTVPELETFVQKSRDILQDSSKQGILPPEIYQLWDTARVAIIPLVPSAKAGTSDDTNAGMRTAAASAIQAFYDKFRDLVSGLDVYSHNEMRGKFSSVKVFVNPYFDSRQYYDFTGRLKKATSGSDWLDVFDDFKTTSHELFAYVADKLQAKARSQEAVDLPATRTRIRETIKRLGPSLQAGNASPDDVTQTADLIDDFVANLRAAAAPLDHEAHTKASKGSMGSTSYTATHFSESSAYDLRVEIRQARTDAGKWEAVFHDFEGAAAAVDSYLADASRSGYSEQADQLRLAGGLSAEVDALLRDHPDAVKVPALFYPKDETSHVKGSDFVPAKAIPLYFYLYKDGSDWKMVDVTTPLRVKVNSADSLPNGDPDPKDLLPKLDSKLRFPKGMLFVRMPNGTSWTQETTARMTVSEWLTYIGLGLGAVALGLATFGAGTAATVFFFGAAVAGGGAAIADMVEKNRQGLLTVTDAIIDLAQVVSEVAGFTALTASKILRTITVAELGLRAEMVFVTAVKTKVIAQGVALIAMDVRVLEELNAIDNAGGSAPDRELAKERLAASALTTSAMVILSMQGDIADFQGKNLYIDKDFAGKALARPVRPDVHLFDQATEKIGTADELKALLGRNDLPDALLTRIRGEVDFALDSGKIPKDRLRGIVGKLNNAPDATKAAEVLAELRYANRITYAGELARDSQIVTGAKAGDEQVLAGGRKVKVDPVSEADALYVGKDSKVHLDEVKNTTNALRQKLTDKPQQLENLAKWRGGGTDREIAVAIESQEGWTDVFALAPGEKRAVLKAFIEEKIPLRIGPFKMDVAKMEELWDKTVAKAKAMNMWPPKQEFFDNMPTLSDAEKFLGIKF